MELTGAAEASAGTGLAGLTSSVGTLNTGVVALLAWVVVMTLALVAIAIVVFRRWRTQSQSFDTGSISDLSSGASSGDLSDITSTNSGSLGASNSAFNGDGDPGTKL